MAYIEYGILPSNPDDASLVKRRKSVYSILARMTCMRDLQAPRLKCIKGGRNHISTCDVHERIFGQHLRDCSLSQEGSQSWILLAIHGPRL